MKKQRMRHEEFVHDMPSAVKKDENFHEKKGHE
jgi:hypothetical protein